MYNNIIKWSIYLLVFLLPLFFLSSSFEAFEFNKQYLLFFLVSIAFLAWIARMVIGDKEIRFRRTILDIPVLVFMFLAVLSAVFSVDKNSSLFGFYGRFSDNLIGILCFGVLYFLITNNVSLLGKPPVTADKKNGTDQPKSASIGGILKTLLWSAFFVLLFSYFSLFGVWQILNQYLAQFAAGFQLPTTMTSRIFNPIGGSLEALAMFLTMAVVLMVGLLLKGRGKWGKIFLGILLFLTVILLIIIDFTPTWLVLALTLILFLVFAFWSRIFRERVNILLIPIVLVIISLVFSFSRVSGYNLPVLGYNVLGSPKEILLDQKTDWGVTWQAIKEYPVLGSGIGTFSQDFAKFKPLNFNQTNLWQIRFDRGGNQIAEIISNMGILGFLSWLVIAALFLVISYYLLRRLKGDENDKDGYQLPLIFIFLALFIGQFFYYQNTPLAFLFWLTLGLGVVSWKTPLKEKVISFKGFPEMGLVFNMVLILILLVILGTWFFAGRFYLADTKYREGVLSGKLEDLERAVSLNQSRANYRIALSRAYFVEVSDELKKPAEEQNAEGIKANFAKAIDEAKKATQLSPNWVATFENLAMVYRDSRGFAQGANEWAVDSFSKAMKLEPTNPVFITEIGKILKDDKKTDEAKKEFEKALELKPDYSDAKIQLALISEEEGNREEAIAKLEAMVKEYPLSIDANFQLGRLYYNDNQLDEAISQFQKVLQIFPNHSNSLYSLGVIYQQKGENDLAIEAFKMVLELNPGNQDIIAKIEELKK